MDACRAFLEAHTVCTSSDGLLQALTDLTDACREEGASPDLAAALRRCCQAFAIRFGVLEDDHSVADVRAAAALLVATCFVQETGVDAAGGGVSPAAVAGAAGTRLDAVSTVTGGVDAAFCLAFGSAVEDLSTALTARSTPKRARRAAHAALCAAQLAAVRLVCDKAAPTSAASFIELLKLHRVAVAHIKRSGGALEVSRGLPTEVAVGLRSVCMPAALYKAISARLERGAVSDGERHLYSAVVAAGPATATEVLAATASDELLDGFTQIMLGDDGADDVGFVVDTAGAALDIGSEDGEEEEEEEEAQAFVEVDSEEEEAGAGDSDAEEEEDEEEEEEPEPSAKKKRAAATRVATRSSSRRRRVR